MKNLKNLGKALSKAEQKEVNGGWKSWLGLSQKECNQIPGCTIIGGVCKQNPGHPDTCPL